MVTGAIDHYIALGYAQSKLEISASGVLTYSVSGCQSQAGEVVSKLANILGYKKPHLDRLSERIEQGLSQMGRGGA